MSEAVENLSPDPCCKSESRPFPLKVALGLAMVMVVALGLRVLLLWAVAPSVPASDESDYFQRARMLVEDGKFYAVGERAPLSEIAYSGAFRIFGTGYTVARAANVAFSTLAVLAAFLLASELFGRKVGLASAVLLSIYPNIVFYSCMLWTEPLYILLVLFALWTVMRWLRSTKIRWIAAAGTLFGLAALTREIGLVFPAFLAAAILIMMQQPFLHRVRAVSIFLACFCLTILPWTIFASRHHGTLVVLTTTSQVNLLTGNSTAEELPGGIHVYYKNLGETSVERERAAGKIARERIAARQPWWIFEKLSMAFNTYLTPNSFPVYRLLRPVVPGDAWRFKFSAPALDLHRRELALLNVLSYALVLVGGLAGLVMLPCRRQHAILWLFVLSQFIPVVLTFACSRFRAGSEPILLMALAVLALAPRKTVRETTGLQRGLAIAATIALPIIVFSKVAWIFSHPYWG